MLTFTTQYPCPVPFMAGGGHGEYGLCAMEAVSILTGEGNIAPHADIKSVHASLRDLMICANDTLPNGDLPGEVRADGLWPIIPSILETGDLGPELNLNEPLPPQEHFSMSFLKGFPIVDYAMALDEDLIHGAYTSPSNVLRGYIARASNPLQMWERAVHGMKIGVEVFWDEFRKDALPRTEFTDREVERIRDYALVHSTNPCLERKDGRVLSVA